jgi:hypothetical protein
MSTGNSNARPVVVGPTTSLRGAPTDVSIERTWRASKSSSVMASHSSSTVLDDGGNGKVTRPGVPSTFALVMAIDTMEPQELGAIVDCGVAVHDMVTLGAVIHFAHGSAPDSIATRTAWTAWAPHIGSDVPWSNPAPTIGAAVVTVRLLGPVGGGATKAGNARTAPVTLGAS